MPHLRYCEDIETPKLGERESIDGLAARRLCGGVVRVRLRAYRAADTTSMAKVPA